MTYSTSLSGHPLIGVKMTRFVYLDETGTNVKKDPYTIVAGIIVHADEQMDALEREFRRLVIEKVPEEIRLNESKPFSLHAVDYINGNGAFKELKKRGEWPVEKGMDIAKGIISLCTKLNIRIVWTGRPNTEGKLKESQHINTFALAALSIDHFMLSEAHGEVCILVAENHNEHKRKLKALVNGLRNKSALEMFGFKGSITPIRTIKDVVHFVDKVDSYCIQIADTICYIVKKALDENPYYDDLFDELHKLSYKADI